MPGSEDTNESEIQPLTSKWLIMERGTMKGQVMSEGHQFKVQRIQRKCKRVMIWGKGRYPKMQIPSLGLKGEECFPDVFDGVGGGGRAKALRCQMALRVQEAQHTGFLELKEWTGVREGATLGDIVEIQARAYQINTTLMV